VKFSPFDEAAMRRALELAARGLYSTHPNPRVGAVLARDQEIIGEGWHERAGEPHAEPIAIRAAGERARGATAYVTLEPCNHHGRTPPCVDVLLASGVRRVVYAIGDPNPRVNGAGAARLRAEGVTVESGLLAHEAEELNAGFLLRMREGRPFIRLKSAMSLDGRTALANGASRWITSDAARDDVQHWRARSSAVLTSASTVLADDPRLDVRIDTPRQPLRVVLDRRRRVRKSARILRSPGEVLVFAAATAAAKSRARLDESLGEARLERLRASRSGLDLDRVFERPRSSRSTKCWWNADRGWPARCSPLGWSTSGCSTWRPGSWARRRNRSRVSRDSRSWNPRRGSRSWIRRPSVPTCGCGCGPRCGLPN
jgi:diaminohydroxyphosphoribosylaminopyrimidine deaminase/5-amino-6-(5-phosphoribosylamino)uracil reductase